MDEILASSTASTGRSPSEQPVTGARRSPGRHVLLLRARQRVTQATQPVPTIVRRTTPATKRHASSVLMSSALHGRRKGRIHRRGRAPRDAEPDADAEGRSRRLDAVIAHPVYGSRGGSPSTARTGHRRGVDSGSNKPGLARARYLRRH